MNNAEIFDEVAIATTELSKDCSALYSFPTRTKRYPPISCSKAACSLGSPSVSP